MTDKIVPILEQINDLSETQIMLIDEVKKLRGRVAALEACEVPSQKLVEMDGILND